MLTDGNVLAEGKLPNAAHVLDFDINGHLYNSREERSEVRGKV
jgi:hypothetical protein